MDIGSGKCLGWGNGELVRGSFFGKDVRTTNKHIQQKQMLLNSYFVISKTGINKFIRPLLQAIRTLTNGDH